MFMRDRVSAVVPKPPPGRYDGPLKIHLHCDTRDVKILFTLDGSIPENNSEREHGFRCEHYQPLLGYTLRTSGKHVLTVVASKKGLVGTKPQRFVYHIGGHVIERRTPTMADAIINRRFRNMVSLDPSMPLRQAKARSPDMLVTLADTVPQSVLRDEIRSRGSEDIALFRLAHDTRSVSRSDRYRRVLTPSMSLSSPKAPPPKDGKREGKQSPPLSLRSNAAESSSPTRYERPNYSRHSHSACSSQRSSGSGVPWLLDKVRSVRTPDALGLTTSGDDDLGGMLVEVPLKRPFTQQSSRTMSPLKSIRRNRPTTTDHPRLSPTPQLSRAATPNAIPAAATMTQLAVFESRAALVPTDSSYADDPEDVKDDADHVAEATTLVKKESMRLALSSETQSKNFASKMYRDVEDVASKDHDLLHLLLVAKDMAKGNLRRVLCIVPYDTLHRALAKRAFIASTDIEGFVSGIISRVEIDQALAAIRTPEGMFNAKQLLLVCRFIVWLSRPIPEAVFGLVVGQWKTDKLVSGNDPPVSKLTLMTVIEAYRRTRGANPDALKTLFEGFHTKGMLPWDEDLKTVDSKDLLAFIAEKVPVVDAALLEMADMTHPMYTEPVHVWDHGSF